MKRLYEIGLTLTFLLLCVNGVYMIASDQLSGFLPSTQLKDLKTVELVEVGDDPTVVTGTEPQDWSSARASDYREREQGLDKLLWQMVFGWSNLVKGILEPYGLTIISDVLYYILAPIQLVSMGYLAMLTITALRGGFSA